MDLSTMRHRKTQNTSSVKPTKWTMKYYDKNANLLDTTYYHDTCPASGITVDFYDINNRGFKKRSANGEVIVSPMYKRTHIAYQQPIEAVEHSNYLDGGYAVCSGTLPPVPFPEPKLAVPRFGEDNAITQSFANVNMNENNVPLWLGEAKEGIKMFCDIGESLWKLYKSTEAARKAYLKGKLSVKEAQSMTLALQYGILPLEQQLDALSNLFEVKKDQRYTARGLFHHEQERSFDYFIRDNGITRCRVKGKEYLAVHIRAGCLYEVNASGLTPIERYIQPGEIASAMWALSRLSFVIDWFINVGNTIKSWSPATGCNILNSWVTVETARLIELEASYEPAPNHPFVYENISGRGTQELQIVEKRRERVDPFNRPIIPRISVNLNLSKVFSLILLFAKVKQNP